MTKTLSRLKSWLKAFRLFCGSNEVFHEALTELYKANEQELRDLEVPRLKTERDLLKYIDTLVKRDHDYGTCVYAMSMAAVAAFNYVSSKLGASGFQASCADLDIIRRTRLLECGFNIFKHEDLLYPQLKDHFPTYEDLLEENKEHLQEEAKKLLAEAPSAHPGVKAHWEWLAAGQPQDD